MRSPAPVRRTLAEEAALAPAPGFDSARLEELQRRLAATPPGEVHSLAEEMKQLVRWSPEEALQRVDGLSPGSKRNALLRLVFDEYPSERTRELIPWLDRSDFKEDKELLERILRSDRNDLTWREMLAMGPGMNFAEVKQGLLIYAGIDLGRSYGNQIQEALRQTAALPDDERQIVRDHYAGQLVYQDATGNLEVLLKNRGSFTIGTIDRALQDAGLKSTEASREPLLKSEAFRNDPELIGPFVEGWLSAEPEAASRWVAGMPEGRARDRAAYGVALKLLRSGDREQAGRWIERVRDPVLQKELRER